MFLSIGPVSKSGWRYKLAKITCNVMPFTGDDPSKSFCFFFHQVWIGGLIASIVATFLALVAGFVGYALYASLHAVLGAAFGFGLGPVPELWVLTPITLSGLYLIWSNYKKHEHFDYIHKRYLERLIKFNFDIPSMYKYLVEHKNGYVIADRNWVWTDVDEGIGHYEYEFLTMEQYTQQFYIEDAYVRFITYPWVRHFLLKTLRLGYFFKTPEEKELDEKRLEKETKEPGMLSVYWSSVKNKVCPQIEYVD